MSFWYNIYILKKEVFMTDYVAMTLRLDKDLHRVFTAICKNNGLPANLVLRELIKSYISNNKQIDILKGVKK